MPDLPPMPPPLQVGDRLPGLTAGPVTRLMLALYCGASGDHNPIHVDLDYARAAGHDDVFAHGMLGMAWLGRVVTDSLPQARLRELGVRFAALTHVGEVVDCSGTVVAEVEHAGEVCWRIELASHDAAGEPKLLGHAVVALR